MGEGGFQHYGIIGAVADYSLRSVLCSIPTPTAAPVMSVINPFTTPACTISGLKDAWTRLQPVYFPVL